MITRQRSLQPNTDNHQNQQATTSTSTAAAATPTKAAAAATSTSNQVTPRRRRKRTSSATPSPTATAEPARSSPTGTTTEAPPKGKATVANGDDDDEHFLKDVIFLIEDDDADDNNNKENIAVTSSTNNKNPPSSNSNKSSTDCVMTRSKRKRTQLELQASEQEMSIEHKGRGSEIRAKKQAKNSHDDHQAQKTGAVVRSTLAQLVLSFYGVRRSSSQCDNDSTNNDDAENDDTDENNESSDSNNGEPFFVQVQSDPCYTSYYGTKATSIATTTTATVTTTVTTTKATTTTSTRKRSSRSSRTNTTTATATATTTLQQQSNNILYKEYAHFARVGVSDIHRCDSVITSVQSMDEYDELVNHMRRQVNSKGSFLDTKHFAHYVIWKNVPQKKCFAAAGYLAHFPKEKYQVLSQIAIVPHFRRMGLAMRLYKHFNMMFNKNVQMTALGTNLAVEDPEPECSSLLCKAEGDQLDNVIACYDRDVFYRLSSWISEFYEEEYTPDGQPTTRFRYLNNDDELEHRRQMAVTEALVQGTTPNIPTVVVRSYHRKRVHCWFMTKNMDHVLIRVERAQLQANGSSHAKMNGSQHHHQTKKQKNTQSHNNNRSSNSSNNSSNSDESLLPRPFICNSVALEKFNTLNLREQIAQFFPKKYASSLISPECIERMYLCPQSKTFVDIYVLLLDEAALKSLRLSKKDQAVMTIKKLPIAPSGSKS